MDTLNNCVREYAIQLSKGQIQKAYKGIMMFMSDLKTDLEHEYAEYTTSALYFGYMDMTYFAFTPPDLKSRKLKIAVVYLHEECKFEAWLAGNNRQVQAEYNALLSRKDLGRFTLSQINPGVDSIIATSIAEHPDFDDLAGLKKQIEGKIMEFVNDITALLK
ncbi:MAG: hypothetical protein WCG21_05485 [Eubacteriales bacterium]